MKHGWRLNYDGRKILRLRIFNTVYRDEHQVRTRVNALLVSLTPNDIHGVIVVVDVIGLTYTRSYFMKLLSLRLYRDKRLDVVQNWKFSRHIRGNFTRISIPLNCFLKEIWNGGYFELLPKTHTLFGM